MWTWQLNRLCYITPLITEGSEEAATETGHVSQEVS